MSSAQRRSWLFVLATLAASAALVPPGVAVVGAVLGGLTALLALGIVLAHRAHRFINVAHASLGAVAGSLVAYLVVHGRWPFWLAYVLGLVVGAALGVVTGIVLGERLATASRTTALAGSIALAFIFGAAHVGLGMMTGSVLAWRVPIPVTISVFPVVLTGTHVLAIVTVPIALAGVWFFLQRSDAGLRVRALAGNAVHARRLGVDQHRTWRVLWVAIGVLAASAGIAAQPLQGTTLARGPLLGPLVLALAAAAVAGFRDIPLTVASSVALGVAHQALLWRFPVAAVTDVALFVVVVAGCTLRAERLRLHERHDPARDRLTRSPRPVAARHVRMVTVVKVALAVAAVVAAGLVLPMQTPGNAQRAGTIAVFVLAGLAVYVTATFNGVLSLGVWALVGVGATVAGTVGGSSVAGVLAAVAVAAATSMLLGATTVRAGRANHAAVTLAAAFAFSAIATRLPIAAIGDAGPFGLDGQADVATVVVAVAIVATLALGFVRRTRFGRTALAVREDPRLATVHGVRVWPTRMAIDALAGSLAGLAGVLYLWNQRVVHPDAFGAVRSLELVAMSVMGGLGSVVGPLLGGAGVKGSELFADGALHLFATGAGLLLVVLWLRGGLVSLAERVRGSRRRPGSAARSTATSEPAQTTDATALTAPARFCQAPAAETRKVRSDPVVRHLGVVVLLCSIAAGRTVQVLVAGREPSFAIWIVAAMVAAAATAAAAGYARPRVVVAAAFAASTTALSLAVTPIAAVIPLCAGYVLGSSLRSSSGVTAHPLRHASQGWLTTQAVFGAAVGAAFAAGLDGWIVAAPVLAVAVATLGGSRPPARTVVPRSGDCVLELDALTVDVGGNRVVVDGTLCVRRGEIVGLVGTNGVGKTTLLRSIAGETHIDSGSVFVRHVDATVLGPDETFALGLFLSDAENGSSGELTVRENLRLAALAAHRHDRVGDVIDTAAGLHPTLARRLDERAAVLSGGERRLLALAQVAAAQPSVLLVDELARGLGAAERAAYEAILRALASRGTAVLVVDHDVEGLRRVADRIVRLSDGRLVTEVFVATPGGQAVTGARR